MILCDSDVLIYAYDKKSPFHQKAKNFIEEKTKVKGELSLTPQVVLEFFAVVTKQAEQPLKTEVASEIISEIKNNKNLIFIFPQENTYFRALKLAEKYQIKGSDIFDLYLVATMLDNNIINLCTHNFADFRKFSEISVFDPLISRFKPIKKKLLV